MVIFQLLPLFSTNYVTITVVLGLIIVIILFRCRIYEAGRLYLIIYYLSDLFLRLCVSLSCNVTI